MANGESKRLLSFPVNNCEHVQLNLKSSLNAVHSGYHRPTEEQRAAATTRQGTITSSRGEKKRENHLNAATPSPGTFPAPLVLPGDDLSLDPSYPPQSLRSWIREKERNKVTQERRTIYIAAPPEVTSYVNLIENESHSEQENRKARYRTAQTRRESTSSKQKPEITVTNGAAVEPPCLEDVRDYLAAFYHGMPIKLLPSKLSFTTWNTGKSKSLKPKSTPAIPSFIGLNAFSSCTRIRVRSTADDTFPCQLNLDDLLDAAIAMLPEDAYALLLLVDHDLYEDDDDEFVCGRAYGGSRVAVVSTARYNPALDDKHNVEREHAWPASHCAAYMNSCCAEDSPELSTRLRKKPKLQPPPKPPPSLPLTPHSHPLQAALSANLAPSTSPCSLHLLYLSRVCRTASHELAHCLGIDHCVYYACCMQGSASLAEDARQPPYLCPVDLAKVVDATSADVGKRYERLLGFCNKRREGQMFAAFGAWLTARLVEMEAPG